MTCKAYVVNTDTGELTEWLDVGFSRVWQVNGTAYFVRGDGVYRMDEALDVPEMAATVQTAPTRLGTELSKRLRYVMSDGVGDITLTPVFDGVIGTDYPGVVGSDNGVKIGRGNKARWIALKLSSLSRRLSLTSMRLYYELLSRRSL